ncbi:MAG TPA: ester cyclase [Anaerolineaceae bacterium]|nr:ester cyclase [Anaerolineaceae bacterium]HBA90721.1 ester cyclase [Anaerolineaceae bacterium]
MTTKDNKSLVRHLVEEGFNKSNLAAIDELLADNFIDHKPLPGLPPLPPSPAGFKQLATMFRTAFPDLLYTIEDMVADGDKVVIRYSACGTNTGELVGMPLQVNKLPSLGLICSALPMTGSSNGGIAMIISVYCNN